MLGNRTIMTPPEYVLTQMFGDNSQIGTFAKEEYQNKSQKSDTIHERIKNICDYAVDLNEEQESYSMISPWGGEDITVQSPDEIAQKELFEIAAQDKDFPLKQACEMMQNELAKRNIPLVYTLDIIKSYQELLTMPDTLTQNFKEYTETKKMFNQKVNAKKKEVQSEASKEYKRLNDRLSEITSSPMKRVLRKLPYTKTYRIIKEIEDQIDFCLFNCTITDSEITARYFSEDEDPKYSIPCFWMETSDNIEPEAIYIDSEELLKDVIAKIKAQISDEKNNRAYEQCMYFINACRTND